MRCLATDRSTRARGSGVSSAATRSRPRSGLTATGSGVSGSVMAMYERNDGRYVGEFDGSDDPAISDAYIRVYWQQEQLSIDCETTTLRIRGPRMFRCSICGIIEHKGAFHEHHIRYIGPEKICIVCKDCHQRIHHDGGFYDELQPELSRSEAKEKRHKPLRGLRGTAKLLQPGEHEVAPLQRKRWNDA